MIVNLEKFIVEEGPKWKALDQLLEQRAKDPWSAMTLEEALALERAYQRASADLARLTTFSAEPETRRYLESLVARGYAEVHGAQESNGRFRVWHWLWVTWPTTFRRRWRPFMLAFALMAAGVIFGGLAIGFDPSSKEAIMPFSHLNEAPAERVAREEQEQGKHLGGQKAQFSGMLMTHNTEVTLTAMALGMSWGIGTLILMFYNGVILGAVVVDYVLAGQSTFLVGWLLPHGAIEIPAMLVGGQAGFVLASALLGRGQRLSLGARMRAAAPDIVTLSFGASLMLIWAGVVEAFLSQYHQPVIPYAVKIAFGIVETIALWWFLLQAGRGTPRATK